MAAVLALIAAVGWGSSDFAAGTASRRSSPESVVLFTHFVAALCLLPLAVVTGSPTSVDLGWGAIAGLGGAAGALLLYRGLAKGMMAVVAPVTAAGAAAIPVIFGLAQGERISMLGIAGIALALGAIVLMSWIPSEPDADELPPPAVAAPAEPAGETLAPPVVREALVWRHSWIVPTLMAAAVLLAAATAVTPALAALIEGSELPPGGLMTLAFGAMTALVTIVGVVVLLPVIRPPAAPQGRRRLTFRQPGLIEAVFSGVGFGLFFVALAETSSDAGTWPLVSARGISVLLFVLAGGLTGLAITPAANSHGFIFLAGVFDALATISFLLATRSGLLSVAAVLSSLYPGVTVLLARVVTKERCGRTQVVGLAVAGSAVGLLALA